MNYFFIILSCILFPLITCNIFSSTDELENLIEKEKQLVTVLKDFKVGLSKSDEAFVERKIAEHEKELKIAQENVKKYIYNPINSYLLIKRLTANFELFVKRFPAKTIESLRTKLEGILQTDNDLEGAVEGLVRLQRTYQLRSEEFAQGIVDGEKTREKLSVHDLAIIGRNLLRLGYEDYFAIEYLQLAVENFENVEKDEIDIVNVSLALAEIHNKTGNFEAAAKAIYTLLVHDRSNSAAEELRGKYLEAFFNFGKSKFHIANPYHTEYEKGGVYSFHTERLLFSKACRGELKNPPIVDAQMHCRYFSDTPYARIGPFKMEEACLSPVKVYLFYDVIFDDEIEQLKLLSSPYLKVGTIKKGTEDIVVKNRVTKTAFISNDNNVAASRVSRRIEAMTKLSTRSAEPFQVQNYGIGGHYIPHTDSTTTQQPGFGMGTGNRIATVLFYMSNVEKGGYTVFPYLNIRVPPVKGLGVFWTNLQQSGEAQFYTRHGSCPVLLGSKWVTNKWLHEHYNELLMPCELEEVKNFSEQEFFQQNL